MSKASLEELCWLKWSKINTVLKQATTLDIARSDTYQCQKLPFEPMKPPVKIHLELVDLNLGLKLTEKCCGNLLVVLVGFYLMCDLPNIGSHWEIVDKCKCWYFDHNFNQSIEDMRSKEKWSIKVLRATPFKKSWRWTTNDFFVHFVYKQIGSKCGSSYNSPPTLQEGFISSGYAIP